MRRVIFLAVLPLLLPLAGFEVRQEKVGEVLMTKVDSPWFKITVNPLGGRFWSIFSKEMQSELIDTVEGGSGTENVWNVPKSRFFLRNKPFSVQKTKIMASSPIALWQIDGETVETVTDFIFLGSKITADGDCSHEIKRRLLLGKKVKTNLDSIL